MQNLDSPKITIIRYDYKMANNGGVNQQEREEERRE
jgi:hypothetical protein